MSAGRARSAPQTCSVALAAERIAFPRDSLTAKNTQFTFVKACTSKISVVFNFKVIYLLFREKKRRYRNSETVYVRNVMYGVLIRLRLELIVKYALRRLG